jgi:hypothetical protein
MSRVVNSDEAIRPAVDANPIRDSNAFDELYMSMRVADDWVISRRAPVDTVLTPPPDTIVRVPDTVKAPRSPEVAVTAPVIVTDVPTKVPSPRIISDVPSLDSIRDDDELDSLIMWTPMVPAPRYEADMVPALMSEAFRVPRIVASWNSQEPVTRLICQPELPAT